MGLRKFFCLLIVCAVMVGLIPTGAAVTYTNNPVLLEDLPCARLGSALSEYQSSARATSAVNTSISANSGMTIGFSISLEKNETVTFNCSYTPRSASMQFGLIDSSGTFHYIPVDTGSINRSICITTRDNYTLAIWNDSSSTVSVSGYVTY